MQTEEWTNENYLFKIKFKKLQILELKQSPKKHLTKGKKKIRKKMREKICQINS